MTPSSEEPSGNAAKPAARSRLLACWVFLCGLLTVVLGLGLAGVGLGFANATASGTGMAAVCVGLWTMVVVRGVARRRLATFLGLCAAWAWLIGRVYVDLPATATSVMMVLLLFPAVGIPLGLAWLTFVVLSVVAGLVRTVKALSEWRRDRAAGTQDHPVRASLGIAIRLAMLAAVTLWTPQAVWHIRQGQIDELAREYAPGDAVGQKRPALGACSMVFLGYELTQHGESAKTDEQRQRGYDGALADAEADLASIAKADARYVRIGASGDQLLVDKPDQEQVDDRYMAAVRRTGMATVLVDTQHPKVLHDGKLDWDGFCRFQRKRIEYYQRRYHPDVYLVVCEPMTYHQFALLPEVKFSAEVWAEQLCAMCRLVKSIDPQTRTGICLLTTDDRKPEWEVWTRMRRLKDLDILSVEIYEPRNFRQTQERLAEFGHPRETGKSFWIAETYNGWALCGARRWDQDVAWLRVADGFARVVDAEAVLVWTFGTFVPGGSFWDFGKGGLHSRWGDGQQLSIVGQEFADLASGDVR